MNPFVSWGIVLLLGGLAAYIYKPDLIAKVLPTNNTTAQPVTAGNKQVKPKTKSKKPKAVQEVLEDETNKIPSGSEELRAKKKRKIAGPVDPTVTVTTTNGEQKEVTRDINDDVDDKTFAQQLARAQSGTKLQSGTHQKQSTPRTTGATLKPKQSDDMLSTAELSSTTGQDADDDMSSVESPQQRPTSGKDISDMLEAPGAAPTTLRLTNVSNEPRKAKAGSKQFEQVQSKKKRNEQARREEQKRLREESDQIHEQKKQDQLRRARMAEGTSNQTKANTFTSGNAWQSKKSDESNAKLHNAPLLDTFEPSGPKAATSSGVQTASMSTAVPTNNATSLKNEVGANVASALAASSREQASGKDWPGTMTEEEQLRRLRDQEQDDAWESVTNKRTKKKTRLDNDTSSEASFSVSQPVPAPVTKAASKAPVIQTNGVSKSKDTVNRFETIQPVNLEGLQDDEWAA